MRPILLSKATRNAHLICLLALCHHCIILKSPLQHQNRLYLHIGENYVDTCSRFNDPFRNNNTCFEITGSIDHSTSIFCPKKCTEWAKKIVLEMWVEELNTCQEKFFQAYKVVVVSLFMRRSTIFFSC